MITNFAIEWKNGPRLGKVTVTDGDVVRGTIVRGEGAFSAEEFSTVGGPVRLEIEVELSDTKKASAALVMIDTTEQPFSFFLRDVSGQHPIYIPAYEVIVIRSEDARSYEQIENEIKALNLLTELQQIDADPEENYENAASHTREIASQTWLGLSRDIRIFGVGFRGVGGEERLWDWVQPRFHGYEVTLPENKDRPVCYRYMLGRGIGCVEGVTRRLEDGTLPILHAEITDNDVVYNTISFVSYENSRLNAETLRGTHYLAADGYGHGHMFTEAQKSQREQLLQQELDQAEETVHYFRAIATNHAKVPRYAWFKNVIPNAFVLNNDRNYTFDAERGYVQFSEDRVCCVSKLNGEPLRVEETAILIPPGETATFEFYLPHQPISRKRAEGLISQSFTERLEECREFWQHKLSKAAAIKLPEKRIEEMVKAGLLHLDLVTYGLEAEGTVVPTIGVYTAIGSESAPIIQFMDSMGWGDLAERSLQFFLDKQHDDGFIQNFGGYILETGAALWSIGEHYRYTKNDEWLSRITGNLLKAFDYLVEWRNRNKTDGLLGKGYGMLEGKTADPEDPFHSFMLNGYAYLGMSRLAEILASSDPLRAGQILEEAEALKEDIREGLFTSMSRSPVVPLSDGSWVPTVPPWVEDRGPLSLYANEGKWFTHGSAVARDSLLGPLYLVLQEVVKPDEAAAEFILSYHNELMCTNNVALSQPYYSIHPWVHLKRGEVKAFLKAYYNGFASLADRETYTFWEHFWYASPHKTHEEAWFLMQTRWMLYMEEGSALKLLPGIPRKWMEHGNVIELNDITTYFGSVTLQVESQLEQGMIVARITCESDRRPESLIVRLPHPDGIFPSQVIGGTYSNSLESVQVDHFTGYVEIILHF